jgi:uncharacterized protein YggU (UPF0235/DUF167 family)
LNSTPENNKANDELVRYLSKLLKVRKDLISVLSGHKSREKVILIRSDGKRRVDEIHRILENEA